MAINLIYICISHHAPVFWGIRTFEKIYKGQNEHHVNWEKTDQKNLPHRNFVKTFAMFYGVTFFIIVFENA
jgi:hypothetical protein